MFVGFLAGRGARTGAGSARGFEEASASAFHSSAPPASQLPSPSALSPLALRLSASESAPQLSQPPRLCISSAPCSDLQLLSLFISQIVLGLSGRGRVAKLLLSSAPC